MSKALKRYRRKTIVKALKGPSPIFVLDESDYLADLAA